MVRIVQEQEVKPIVPKNFEQQHRELLKVIGLLVAQRSNPLLHLLNLYGKKIPQGISKEQLTERLLDAIAENDPILNHELALLILDLTLEENYDQFDFSAIKDKVGGVLSSGASGAKSGGLVGGITGTLGGIGSLIGGKGKQRAQASADAQQALIDAQNQQQATVSKKKKMMILILAAAGICLLGALLLYKKPAQNEVSPLNT